MITSLTYLIWNRTVLNSCIKTLLPSLAIRIVLIYMIYPSLLSSFDSLHFLGDGDRL